MAIAPWGDSLDWPLSLGLEIPGSKPKSSEEDWEPSALVCFSRTFAVSQGVYSLVVVAGVLHKSRGKAVQQNLSGLP